MALLIPPDVLRQLATMPKRDRERVLAALQTVATDLGVRPSFVTEMVGHPGVWRLRKGNWRAAYRIVGDDIVVDAVGHRREIYR
ncbi:MAG: type II toxin-antitoxin system RelE family toxin [Acetobacteraceae bacterium]